MSITAPKGFRAAGVKAGLKASGNPDLALVVNDGPTKAAAAVFTSNRVAAAPVHWSREVIKDGRVDAVILNSGGANACTGPQGFQNTHTTAEKTAEALGVSATDVFVCSTGLIGEQLPMDKIGPGDRCAPRSSSDDGGPAAATAIMTTDSVSKQAVFTGTDAEGKRVHHRRHGQGRRHAGAGPGHHAGGPHHRRGGPARNARRRAPRRHPRHLRPGRLGRLHVHQRHRGAAGLRRLRRRPVRRGVRRSGLTQVCAELARKLIGDAEGASHDIAIRTFNAASERDAEVVSRAVARSNLFKTAIFGKDPNWGRVLSAVGTTDAVFEPDQLNVAMNGVQICRNGSIGDDRNLVDLEPREVLVEIDLQAGDAEATIWTNDLTHDYVHENSAYSS